MTRHFVRLPAFASVEEAIDYCAANGYGAPRLHDCQSVPVVGSVEATMELAVVTASEPDGGP